MQPLAFDFPDFLVLLIQGVLDGILEGLTRFIEKRRNLHLRLVFEGNFFLLEALNFFIALGENLFGAAQFGFTQFSRFLPF